MIWHFSLLFSNLGPFTLWELCLEVAVACGLFTASAPEHNTLASLQPVGFAGGLGHGREKKVQTFSAQSLVVPQCLLQQVLLPWTLCCAAFTAHKGHDLVQFPSCTAWPWVYFTALLWDSVYKYLAPSLCVRLVTSHLCIFAFPVTDWGL